MVKNVKVYCAEQPLNKTMLARTVQVVPRTSHTDNVARVTRVGSLVDNQHPSLNKNSFVCGLADNFDCTSLSDNSAIRSQWTTDQRIQQQISGKSQQNCGRVSTRLNDVNRLSQRDKNAVGAGDVSVGGRGGREEKSEEENKVTVLGRLLCSPRLSWLSSECTTVSLTPADSLAQEALACSRHPNRRNALADPLTLPLPQQRKEQLINEAMGRKNSITRRISQFFLRSNSSEHEIDLI